MSAAVAEKTSPPSKVQAMPNELSSAGSKAKNKTSPSTKDDARPEVLSSAGSQTDQRDQSRLDTQTARVALVTNSETGEGAIISDSMPKLEASLADPGLGLAAEILDDLERTRIANENRLRQLTGTDVDDDGVQRQRMYDPAHSDIVALTGLVGLLAEAEHKAVLHLQRVVRRHPLGIWGKAIPGIGEKQLARLLAVIGDPYLREEVTEEGEIAATPRTVSALWSYCGYRVDDGKAVRRSKGQKANWSTLAKTRSYLIVEACLKAHSRYPNPYGATYYERKKHTEGRVHVVACQVCAGKGKSADDAIGMPWKDGHRHADALRVAAKALLRDLWREARRIHDQVLLDAQEAHVA